MPALKKQIWQEALSDLLTDPKELLELLELDPNLLGAATAAAQAFPLKVPRGFIKRIQKGNLHDPLLKQILPIGVELNVTPGYLTDPLLEKKVNPVPGLLHKYYGRVLITLTAACAIHCRYCFRRHFPYEANNPGTSGWEKIYRYIKENKSISEVILSGGDPLAVNDKLLKMFCNNLTEIAHVTRLRIHTRLPVVIPERITLELINWMKELPLNVVIVVHINHPNEINDEVKQAIHQLRTAGILVLNQTVLLRGVNDDAHLLITLSETLFSVGVLPYYLHVLDKVQGAAHFDITLEKALELHSEMSKSLPGYLVPRLACEEAGEPSKTWLGVG